MSCCSSQAQYNVASRTTVGGPVRHPSQALAPVRSTPEPTLFDDQLFRGIGRTRRDVPLTKIQPDVNHTALPT